MDVVVVDATVAPAATATAIVAVAGKAPSSVVSLCARVFVRRRPARYPTSSGMSRSVYPRKFVGGVIR